MALGAALWAAVISAADPDKERAGTAPRLSETVTFLASDEMEGRGLATTGINLCAEFIAHRFHELGLEMNHGPDGAFQKFNAPTGAELGAENHLAVMGPDDPVTHKPRRRELVMQRDFTTLAASDSAKFDLPLVFVGYGITDKVVGYDDYAGLDVTGKAVVVLRREPPHFDEEMEKGGRRSRHSWLRHKMSNAFAHGAAAVVFCNDDADAGTKAQPTDSLLPFRAAGLKCSHAKLPVMHCRRSALDEAMRSAYAADFDSVEAEIDQGFRPRSRELTGWRIAGQTDIRRVEQAAQNVIGILPGKGPRSEETIVIGAHYDHFGLGDARPGEKRAIYHGADDNASGVAMMLELARRFAQRPEPLGRRVMFIAFSAEELGYLGSTHYVNNPVVPLDRTVAMFNFDMVGRLRDNKLVIQSGFTSHQWAALLGQANTKHQFAIEVPPDRFGRSDQLPFYAKRIPVMHVFTGRHEDYHEPTDTTDKINFAGMQRIADFAEEMILPLADGHLRPHLVAAALRDENAPYFGAFGDFTRKEPGFAIGLVDNDGPAKRAGLHEGDLVIQVAENRIATAEDFSATLDEFAGGEKVQVLVKRGGRTRSLQVTLDRPGRLSKTIGRPIVNK